MIASRQNRREHVVPALTDHSEMRRGDRRLINIIPVCFVPRPDVGQPTAVSRQTHAKQFGSGSLVILVVISPAEMWAPPAIFFLAHLLVLTSD